MSQAEPRPRTPGSEARPESRLGSPARSDPSDAAQADRPPPPRADRPAAAGEKRPRWFDPGLRFTCTQCGNCCTGPSGFVWFNPDEQQAMADYLSLSVEAFREKYVVRTRGGPRGGLRDSLGEVRNERGQFDCVFLQTHPDGRRTCSIYPVRPTQCRTWPFWASNLASPRHWDDAARTCPGMKRGGVNESPQDSDAHESSRGRLYRVEEILTIEGRNPRGL